MKRTVKTQEFINKEIKVGDQVYLVDGSGLSLLNNEKEVFIVYSYPEITGIDETLKKIKSEVIEVGISDSICVSTMSCGYVQDIVIKIGKAKFRTPSAFVRLA